MATNPEVIALLLDEPQDGSRNARSWRRGAQRLVREESGRVVLEAVTSDEEFDDAARTTGCFIRAKAIRDPATLEIIGYEMEEVSPLARSRKQPA